MKNIAWGFGMKVISILNVIAREKADLDNEYNSKLTEKCAKLMGIWREMGGLTKVYHLYLSQS